MKVVKYELTIVHKKTVSVSAEDRKHVEELLRNMLETKAGLEVSAEEIRGVMAEEKASYNCPERCEICRFYCPGAQECMEENEKERCADCPYYCNVCGRCELKEAGDCGQECIDCKHCCPECNCCTHPVKEQQPGKHLVSAGK